MFDTIVAPSLPEIRVRLIQKELQKYRQRKQDTIRAVATGRTGSGKSTLGNLLVGIDYFLKSDGHLDEKKHIPCSSWLSSLLEIS